ALPTAYAEGPDCLGRLRERCKSLPTEKRPGHACDARQVSPRDSTRHIERNLG
ncbi:DDE transposase, partial [Ralstonia pseudosolanacearum]